MSAAATLLRLRAASRVLDVEWADGTTTALSYELLRDSCPCALCRQRRCTGGAALSIGPVEITAIVPCGSNAIQVRFGDGHERGIFPFSYLRELGEIARNPGAGISK